MSEGEDGHEGANATRERVAAILAADAVGYSRLMADDEPATVAALDRARDVFHAHVEGNQGRVVDTAGDSVLAVFETTTGAVRASIAIQEGLAALNADTPADRRMLFRVGIHLGDIIEKIADGTIYGDGVNVAARLEALSEPGGITVSDSVHGSIRERLDVGFELLGEHRGKNLKSPVVAYRLLPDGAATPMGKSKRWLAQVSVAAAILALGLYAWLQQSPAIETASRDRMAFPLPAEPSIAVLPFDNVSASDEHDYVADGLAENIIAALSQARDMVVIARNSTFTYKGRAVKVQDVAEDLGVQYVLEGSIQVEGQNIRVTAQLIDALGGQHLWSDRYDRALNDVFAVQDEIALNVVSALQVRLTEGPHAVVWRGGTKSLKAWSLFQRGREQLLRFTEAGNTEARSLFEQAVDIDPAFALAKAQIGNCHRIDVMLGYSADPGRSLDLALSHAKEAVALDANSADAHVMLATVLRARRDFARAVEEIEIALRLGPGHGFVLGVSGQLLATLGQPERAIGLMQRAMRLSPSYPDWYPLALAEGHLLAGQPDKALSAMSAADDEYVSWFQARMEIAALAGLGRQDEAHIAVSERLEADPEFSIARIREHMESRRPYVPEAVDTYLTLLRAAGVPERPPGTESERPVIAVLPFESLSGVAEHEFFADGIVEDIITRLARFPDIGVIARNSSFQYKGRNVDVRTVAEELGATYVLEGSVRRSESAIRVSAQLLDARDGTHVWAETYDRDLTAGDIFAVQDDITARVVGAIASIDGTVALAADAALASKPPAELSSYECMLQASAYGRALTPDQHLRVRTCIEQVVREEPELSRAWMWLCFVTIQEYSHGFNPLADLAPPLDRAQDYCGRAIELDPTDGWGYLTSGRVSYFRHNLPAFRSAADRALELAPNDAAILAMAGMYFALSGGWERGLALIDRAIELNPHHQPWYHFPKFYDAYRRGDDEAALEAALKINLPDFFALQVITAAVYGQLGMLNKASEVVDKILELKPGLTVEFMIERWRRWNFEEPLIERMGEGLRKAGMPGATD